MGLEGEEDSRHRESTGEHGSWPMCCLRAHGLTAGQFHFGPVDARLMDEILIDALILLLPALQYTS